MTLGQYITALQDIEKSVGPDVRVTHTINCAVFTAPTPLIQTIRPASAREKNSYYGNVLDIGVRWDGSSGEQVVAI